tara:strand:- start:3 stop:248 length:246 start_codon:yes stop_codon:yes gene_type:complete
MKTLVIKKDKTKIVKSFATPNDAVEYLFRYIPNGKFDGLDCCLNEIRQVINILWYDYCDSWILDNHTLKIKNPTKILKENQ